jgi:hypothetical protein
VASIVLSGAGSSILNSISFRDELWQTAASDVTSKKAGRAKFEEN